MAPCELGCTLETMMHATDLKALTVPHDLVFCVVNGEYSTLVLNAGVATAEFQLAGVVAGDAFRAWNFVDGDHHVLDLYIDNGYISDTNSLLLHMHSM